MKEDINILRGCSIQTSDSGTCNPHSCNKLNVHNYLEDIPENSNTPEIVEIRFKNTRKAFYLNVNKLKLKQGDMVAVEASPGHDIGTVSLTGELVREQMRRKRVFANSPLKKVYRKVKELDIEKWEQAIARENSVMLRARQLAKRLELDMKIGDVEFQGDGSKAIFYYIADKRVDFRQLIRVFADEFKIRIEMRQIGARQEAGRIGGIGSCGRELCCASWMSTFVSVSTEAARDQEISLNPQKLAGQCGKLKCCLNYEQASYKDAKKDFPRKINLETEEGTAYFFKSDIHKKTMWYSFDAHMPQNVTAVSTDRVKEVIAMNSKGEKPEKLALPKEDDFKPLSYTSDLASQSSLTRFDEQNARKKNKRRRKKRPTQNQNNNQKNTNKQAQNRRRKPNQKNGNKSVNQHNNNKNQAQKKEDNKSTQQKSQQKRKPYRPKNKAHYKPNPRKHNSQKSNQNKPQNDKPKSE